VRQYPVPVATFAGMCSVFQEGPNRPAGVAAAEAAAAAGGQPDGAAVRTASSGGGARQKKQVVTPLGQVSLDRQANTRTID